MKSELPTNWQRKHLADVSTIIMGQSPPSSTYNIDGKGLPFFQGKAEFGETNPSVEKWCSDPGKIAEPNDVLLSVRAPVGPTNLANVKCCIGRGLSAIRYNFPDAHKFLYYYFKSIEPNLSKQGTGSTFKAISKKTVETLQFPLPPLPEQKRIVAKIEELFSDLDKAVEALKKAQAQLKTYRQAVLKYAFEGRFTNKNVKPGELPEGWRWVRLGEVIESSLIGLVRSNLHQNSLGQGVPYVKMNNLDMDGNVNLNNIVYVKVSKEETHKYSLKKNDVLLNTRNSFELVGKTGIVKDDKVERVFNNNIMRMRFNPDIDSAFICYQINGPEFRKIMTRGKKATTNICALYQKDIFPMLIGLAPLHEQKQIVQEIEKRLSEADYMEKTIIQSIEKADATRQSILKKAFEGRLVIPTEINISQHSEIKASPSFAKKYPRRIAGIAEIELQTGIISMVIEAHENNPKHLDKLSHVKCEKISDLVERKLGISLGRTAMKDAAGPDDFKHLKKVEHRAHKAGYFKEIATHPIGHTYKSMRNMQRVIVKTKSILTEQELAEIDNLITTFLPFELEHAELVATIFAGWNNLLLLGKNPSDEEIVYESRENWSKRKLAIDRGKFFKTLNWMRSHNYIPEGKGTMILKKEEIR